MGALDVLTFANRRLSGAAGSAPTGARTPRGPTGSASGSERTGVTRILNAGILKSRETVTRIFQRQEGGGGVPSRGKWAEPAEGHARRRTCLHQSEGSGFCSRDGDAPRRCPGRAPSPLQTLPALHCPRGPEEPAPRSAALRDGSAGGRAWRLLGAAPQLPGQLELLQQKQQSRCKNSRAIFVTRCQREDDVSMGVQEGARMF